MSTRPSSLSLVVGVVLGLVVIGIVGVFLSVESRRTAASRQAQMALEDELTRLKRENTQLRERLGEAGDTRSARQGILPVYSQVGPFQLTNQHGKRVTLEDLKGRVWLANIVFTRCPGPCPMMSRGVADLMSSLKSHPAVKFVTLTTDPDHDTPARMLEFAKPYNPDFDRWIWLTGSKPELAKLAVEGLKLTGVEKAPEARTNPADLFIHSTILVLVDALGQVRGTFEFTDEDLSGKVQRALEKLATPR